MDGRRSIGLSDRRSTLAHAAYYHRRPRRSPHNPDLRRRVPDGDAVDGVREAFASCGPHPFTAAFLTAVRTAYKVYCVCWSPWIDLCRPERRKTQAEHEPENVIIATADSIIEVRCDPGFEPQKPPPVIVAGGPRMDVSDHSREYGHRQIRLPRSQRAMRGALQRSTCQIRAPRSRYRYCGIRGHHCSAFIGRKTRRCKKRKGKNDKRHNKSARLQLCRSFQTASLAQGCVGDEAQHSLELLATSPSASSIASMLDRHLAEDELVSDGRHRIPIWLFIGCPFCSGTTPSPGEYTSFAPSS